jgi:hypothetical protein
MTETLDKLQETHHIRNESGTQKNIPESNIQSFIYLI